jgi:hypothetical protein
MKEHKKDVALTELTSRALRARRRRLVARLPDLEGFLAGSLVEQSRRCGKEGCRCAGGELHGPYVYLSVRPRPAGRRSLVYVPEVLAELVRRRVSLGESAQQLLTEISAINLELLARRELE